MVAAKGCSAVLMNQMPPRRARSLKPSAEASTPEKRLHSCSFLTWRRIRINRSLCACLWFFAFLAQTFCQVPKIAYAEHNNPFSEEEIKAAFLYNFASFVYWPVDALQKPDTPLQFCIIGDSAVAGPLKKVLEGQRVDHHPLTFRQTQKAENLESCHVVYVDTRQRAFIQPTLKRVRDLPILTVSDYDEFVTAGGMITLVRRNRRIHPVINVKAVSNSRLKINAKLMKLATLVFEENELD